MAARRRIRNAGSEDRRREQDGARTCSEADGAGQGHGGTKSSQPRHRTGPAASAGPGVPTRKGPDGEEARGMSRDAEDGKGRA